MVTVTRNSPSSIESLSHSLIKHITLSPKSFPLTSTCFTHPFTITVHAAASAPSISYATTATLPNRAFPSTRPLGTTLFRAWGLSTCLNLRTHPPRIYCSLFTITPLFYFPLEWNHSWGHGFQSKLLTCVRNWNDSPWLSKQLAGYNSSGPALSCHEATPCALRRGLCNVSTTCLFKMDQWNAAQTPVTFYKYTSKIRIGEKTRKLRMLGATLAMMFSEFSSLCCQGVSIMNDLVLVETLVLMLVVHQGF